MLGERKHRKKQTISRDHNHLKDNKKSKNSIMKKAKKCCNNMQEIAGEIFL